MVYYDVVLCCICASFEKGRLNMGKDLKGKELGVGMDMER